MRLTSDFLLSKFSLEMHKLRLYRSCTHLAQSSIKSSFFNSKLETQFTKLVSQLHVFQIGVLFLLYSLCGKLSKHFMLQNCYCFVILSISQGRFSQQANVVQQCSITCQCRVYRMQKEYGHLLHKKAVLLDYSTVYCNVLKRFFFFTLLS